MSLMKLKMKVEGVKVFPNVERHMLQSVIDTVKEGIRVVSGKKYGLIKGADRAKATRIALKCLTVRNFPTRHGGLGGRNTIFINLGRWSPKERFFMEYDRYKDDPDIGEVRDVDHVTWAKLLTLHELSHHIQKRYAPRAFASFPYNYDDWRASHGNAFKQIYRILRVNVINPCIRANKKQESEGMEEKDKPKLGWGGKRDNQHGRPKLPPERRRVFLQCRIDPETKKLLEQHAGSVGRIIDTLVQSELSEKS